MGTSFRTLLIVRCVTRLYFENIFQQVRRSKRRIATTTFQTPVLINMKKITVILFCTILIVLNIAFIATRKDIVFEKKEKLSDYNFFIGKLSDLQPAVNVIPYGLNTPLFNNYAEKLRFIKLPAGTKAVYNDTASFEMPVGTVLIKNFYYPFDFRKPQEGKRIMETRLMIHETNGWSTLPYIWNDEQTEAFYDVAGENKTVNYIDASGKKITTQYLIPNKNQCKGCHIKNEQVLPIGIAARHLNGSYTYTAGKENQLTYWANAGILEGLPAINSVPKNAVWNDVQTGPAEQRARAYLDINCGHCHSNAGPANTSGLFLDINEKNETALGILKTPVAAGQGSGNLQYDIVPGHPEKSILVYRITTTDPGFAMPEIGREQIHKEGVALISEWIKNMRH